MRIVARAAKVLQMGRSATGPTASPTSRSACTGQCPCAAPSMWPPAH